MSVKIQIRRGTATEWSNANPTLAAGELGYDTTNDILKVGDGATAWSSLAEADNQSADQVTYAQVGQTYALGANVQAAIYAIDDELIVQDGRLDIVQGDASTVGSIAKAEADAKAYTDTRETAITSAYEAYADQAEVDAKAYADAQIDAAKLALGTNFSVADIAGRDALTGLTVGDLIFVTDDGDGKWAQYKVTVADPIAYEKIMDEDIYLNAISASAVKTAYESNADTNAFTDALLSKLNAIEAEAKDDQDADEVPYVDTGQTYALGSDVQTAIYAVDDELIALDGRLDIVQGDASTVGSIAKAEADAKAYADTVAAGQNDANEIAYDATGQTYALGSDVQAAIYAVDDELISLDGRLDTAESDIDAVEGRLDIIEGDANTAGSIAKAEADAKAYADAQITAAELALGTNFSVADIAARDALTGLTVGDLIFVTDDGDTKWAQYKVTAVTDGDGSTSTFEKIMDEDIYLNAISASAVKTAYESNADTNALTDAGLQILAGNHPANQVLAGPTTGADAPAGYRALVPADVPSLDAAKITTGTFSDTQIPSLEANKITTGTFDVARIPDLSANKITSDTLNADRIPTLAQSKVTNLTTDLADRVVGPASATNANFATFDGTTGKLVADSGFSASSFAKISIGSTEPVSPSAGDLWFNNDVAVKNLFFYDGTEWIGVNTYQ